MSNTQQPIIIIDRTNGLIQNVISTIPNLKVIVIDEDFEPDSVHTSLRVPGLCEWEQTNEYFFMEANVTRIGQEEAEAYSNKLYAIFQEWTYGDEEE